MDALYERYRHLHIDGSQIGLEAEENPPYFCTPAGADILGWDNGIHYCFIEGFGDWVFCVNPEPLCDRYVYPIARNFSDFLGLILATGNTNVLQQIIGWDKNQFEDFTHSTEERENKARPEVQEALRALSDGIGIRPMEDPFGYVKEVQSHFPYESILFCDGYYEALGIDRPERPASVGMEGGDGSPPPGKG